MFGRGHRLAGGVAPDLHADEFEPPRQRGDRRVGAHRLQSRLGERDLVFREPPVEGVFTLQDVQLRLRGAEVRLTLLDKRVLIVPRPARTRVFAHQLRIGGEDVAVVVEHRLLRLHRRRLRGDLLRHHLVDAFQPVLRVFDAAGVEFDLRGELRFRLVELRLDQFLLRQLLGVGIR